MFDPTGLRLPRLAYNTTTTDIIDTVIVTVTDYFLPTDGRLHQYSNVPLFSSHSRPTDSS